MAARGRYRIIWRVVTVQGFNTSWRERMCLAQRWRPIFGRFGFWASPREAAWRASAAMALRDIEADEALRAPLPKQEEI